jgi:16S rRNA (uracil1498-N3)-methyltransferase
MSSPPWFFHPFKEIQETELEISGEQANHILGARRMHPGDQLVLTNGCGKLAHCVLQEANKKARLLLLRVSLVAQLDPPQIHITLAAAIPRGDRLASMLDMTCQLGISTFQPLEFEHSVSKWGDKLGARCERVLTEACKQSKYAWIPRVNSICDYRDLLANCDHSTTFMLLADQCGRPAAAYANLIEEAKSICVIIGPEGGLSSTETQLARENEVATLRLAASILRIETAAVAAVAVLQNSLSSGY